MIEVRTMNHPALSNQGVPREHICVSEWEAIIKKLSARMESCDPEDREFFARLRMSALAARDRAWLAREAGLRELVGAK